MTILVQGGVVLWAIVGLSVLALAIIIEKIWLLALCRTDNVFLKKIAQDLNPKDRIDWVKKWQGSKRLDHQLAVIVLQHYGLPRNSIRDYLVIKLQDSANQLTSKVGTLSIIITVAPMLGLLGTVLGLVDVFSVLSMDGGMDQAKLLSMGISKALITTGGGLILAIPLILIQHLLERVINRRLDQWDTIPSDLTATLTNQ